MTYEVHVTEPAHADIEAAYEWLKERTDQYAVAWFNGLANALDGLAHLPARCPLAAESRHFHEKVYQLLYGKRPHLYRVLFVVRGKNVFILHVRHGARSELQPGEIRLPRR